MTHNQHLLANQEIPTSESRSAKMRIGVASLEYNRTQGIERGSAKIGDRLPAWDIRFINIVQRGVMQGNPWSIFTECLPWMHSTRYGLPPSLPSRLEM